MQTIIFINCVGGGVILFGFHISDLSTERSCGSGFNHKKTDPILGSKMFEKSEFFNQFA